MTVIRNRVGWAKKDLHLEGLLESTRRGVFRITKKGLDLLATNPARLTRKDFDYFASGTNPERSEEEEEEEEIASNGGQTPLERIEAACEEVRRSLTAELLEQLAISPPEFLEKTVLKLLTKMGYGGMREGAGSLTPKSGDGGIDGIIREDILGLHHAIFRQSDIKIPSVDRISKLLQERCKSTTRARAFS